MNKISAYVDVAKIKAQYRPYNTMQAFEWGFADYLDNRMATGLTGIAAQAYDRGQAAAMKVIRDSEWVRDNVGAN